MHHKKVAFPKVRPERRVGPTLFRKRQEIWQRSHPNQKSPSAALPLEVRYEDENIWITQKMLGVRQLSEIFG